MIQVTDTKEVYRSLFAESQQVRQASEPSWLQSLRQSAIHSFETLGFPTPQHEEWRFTNVAPIARTAFRPARPMISTFSLEEIEPWSLGALDSYRLVFVNGIFSEALSSLESLPAGVIAGSLIQAVKSQVGLVESHLGRYADFHKDVFTALNTALLEDGAFVYIPKGLVLEKPVHLLFLTTNNDQHPSMSSPRSLIIADSSSQVQIVESFAGMNGGNYFTSAVTEMVAGENARMEHYKFQRESRRAFHVSTLQIELGRDANVSDHAISLGGALVRNHVNVVLNGEGAEATLNGFYLVNGSQHVDNQTCIEHAKAHCSSFELYKGILDGSARAVFNGRIIVRPNAQKTDSKQTNKNLILSEDALVNTNPQLEIYADDVKCTHGATIGQLDADALFYLRSRGIDLDSARHLLTYAFASELSHRINIEPLRSELEHILFSRLAEGRETQD